GAGRAAGQSAVNSRQSLVMNISLAKLPWWAQIGAFTVLAVAGCGAFWWYIESPARAEIATRQLQLIALKADVAKGQNTAKKLPAFRNQVTELETRLAGLKAVLPEEKDAADLLTRMQTVAAQSNLTIKSFKPGATVTKQLHAEWPITLELDGTYHNLAIFFDRMANSRASLTSTASRGKARRGRPPRSPSPPRSGRRRS